MKTESEQVPRWDDIIFENRNKEYGAYTIRKSYDDTVLTGWLISLGVIGVIFLSSFISAKEEVIAEVIPTEGLYVLPPIDIEPIRTPKTQPPPPTPPHVNTNVAPAVVTTDVPDVPAAPVDPPSSGSGTDPQVGSSLPGIDLGNVAPPEPPTPAYYLSPEVAPAYEGGIEAMMMFIQRKIHYPASARRKEEQGIVYVSFIINSTGAVTQVEVIKGISKECDQEAVRVISLMNKWKPGLQNKMPVAVKMVLPIKFKLDS